MKKTVTLLFTLSLVFGCAKNIPPPEANALLPEIDLVEVKENAEEALRLAQKTRLDVEALNLKISELGSQGNMPANNIEGISPAKIEEMKKRIELLSAEVKALQKMLEGVELRKKALPPRPMETFKRAPAVTDSARVSGENVKTDSARGAPAPTNSREPYQDALTAYKARDYTNAIRLFKELLENEPRGTYADNCVFWTGECFFMLGDYPQALGWYKKVFDYVDNEKADDAQFKMAKCHMKLGEKDQAIGKYENLLSLYPNSEYVSRAKADLQQLKAQ